MNEPAVVSTWDRRVRALTVGLVAIITLVAFEALAVVTVLPEVAADLHGFALYGWATSAFFLGTTIGIVLAGGDTDQAGPARPFTVGLVCFVIGLLIAAVAPTMPVLVAARALQGAGGGTIPAVAYAAIGRAYPHELRPRVFAVLSTAWVVPGLGGPALSSLIAEHLGWRWVFGGLLPLTIVFGLIPLRALRALPAVTRADGAEGHSSAVSGGGGGLTVAAVRVTLGAGLVLAALTSRSLLGLPSLVAGLVCAGGPLRRLLPAGTLRMRPGVPAAVASRGLLTCAFFGADPFVPLSFTAVRHESTMVAGIAVSGATLCWAAGSWTQARLAGRVQMRSVVTAGLVLVAVGTGGFATVLLEGVPLAVPVACWGVAGYGIGLSYSTIVTLVLALTPPQRQGEASMAVSLTDNLGTAFGAGLGGVAVAASQATGGAPTAGLAATFALTVSLGLVGALLVARRLPEDGHAGG